MSVYKIFKGGEEINRIVASEDFVREYYSQDGYSYELEPDAEPAHTGPQYTSDDLLTALLGGTLAHESGGG